MKENIRSKSSTNDTFKICVLCVLCLAAQSRLTLCDPMDCSPPDSSVHGILQAEYWSGFPWPPPGALPNPGIKPRSPTLQADSLPSEPPGKPSKGNSNDQFEEHWDNVWCLTHSWYSLRVHRLRWDSIWPWLQATRPWLDGRCKETEDTRRIWLCGVDALMPDKVPAIQ